MPSPTKLSLNLDQIPFELEDDLKGTTSYVALVAMDGRRRSDFMTYYSDHLKVDKEGKPTEPKNMPKVQIHLLSLCLCLVELEDGEPVVRNDQWVPTKPLPKDVLSSWPTQILDLLFGKACELNKLNETDEESKND